MLNVILIVINITKRDDDRRGESQEGWGWVILGGDINNPNNACFTTLELTTTTQTTTTTTTI